MEGPRLVCDPMRVSSCVHSGCSFSILHRFLAEMKSYNEKIEVQDIVQANCLSLVEPLLNPSLFLLDLYLLANFEAVNKYLMKLQQKSKG